MQKIYCVEDDTNIRDLVCYALKSSGFQATGCASGEELETLMTVPPDLLLLDIMLPGEDGLKILEDMRKNPQTANLPVILLTAKNSEIDRVRGLDSGADDYIVKPFSVLELVSRVKAVLRRAERVGNGKVSAYNNINIDREKRTVTCRGEKCALTYKEFELLAYLMENEGIVLSRDKILESIWGYDFPGESRTVDMHIKTLRQKLGEEGNAIQTVRGVGYKLGD